MSEDPEDLSKLHAGDHHYKAYVGPPLKYDLVGAMQFNLLTALGLRDHHKLLDIGCGSLRAGKLFIPFLARNNYYGLEPNKWLIDEGIRHELGEDILRVKTPTFLYSENFDLQSFGEQFDYILAQSVFSHASAEQISTCLTEVRQVLKPGGYFLATFMPGKESYTGSDWVYPGCVNYTFGRIAQMIEEQKLAFLKTKWAHPNDQCWYIIFHPENRKEARHRLGQLFLVNKRRTGFLTAQRMRVRIWFLRNYYKVRSLLVRIVRRVTR